MPLAPVDESDTQYYYVDTGAPSRPQYTTLVLIHGAGFQFSIFERLFPFAAEHNVRLVAVNMRDYGGSTPYSQDELADLWSADAGRQARTLRARGHEIATFLLWYIRKENIPLLSQGKQDEFTGGGISVLGWSWGCKMALSCFASAHDLKPADRDLLGNYLRALILLDPSPRVFGAKKEARRESYNPFYDESMSREQLMDFFPAWVSSYYAHSPSMLRTLYDISRASLCAGFAREPIANPPHHQTPSLTRMSEQEATRIVNAGVILRSHVPQEFFDDKVYADNMRRALCDSSVWPNLRVALLWCDMSVSATLLSAWSLLEKYRDAWPVNGRHIDAVRMRNANHFPHWDLPERTMQLLARVLWSGDIPDVVDMYANIGVIRPRL